MPSAAVSRFVPGLILGALSLLSAFLLFQVQPIISNFILPWFGGSPGVWTTCLLFFQIVLFAGYAYAHALTRLTRRWQGVLHGLLLGAAIALLPIAPGEAWKPTGAEDPSLRILLLLAANVGLPYFVLSSTSPLVQVWFTRQGGGKPWRLYAWSNLGSLAALLSYPLFFEVHWDVVEQTTLWSVAFGAFVALSLAGVWMDRRHALAAETKPAEVIDPAADHPGWLRRVLWVLLPALASCLLLSVTNHVCQNVAVIPFLWVVPLSLYLLTFILCFERERWYARGRVLWTLPALLCVFVACIVDRLQAQRFWRDLSPIDLAPDYLWQLGWAFGAMFFACMLCHGELARLKPAPRRLTEFYLLLSAGGALGGLFVSLGAPRLFTTFAEWPISLIAVLALGGVIVLRAVWREKFRALRFGPFRVAPLCMLLLSAGLTLGGLLMGVLGFNPERDFYFKHVVEIERVRNFYGVFAVTEDDDRGEGMRYRRFRHGKILHGSQNLDPALRQEPTTYFGRHTGVGQALESLKDRPAARVGVVGMGAGTVSCYAKAGDTFRFYEINPEVVRIAKKHFTYLADAEKRGARTEVVVGDGRLALEREPAQLFDVLFLDAFSGDSVPVHLLTREAFALYLRHLKPDGILVVQITNTHIVLAPVIEKIAADAGLKTTRIATLPKGDDAGTDHILLARDAAFLRATPTLLIGNEKRLKQDVHLWTDRHHDLLSILNIPQNTQAPRSGD
jgi:hypothetical protein